MTEEIKYRPLKKKRLQKIAVETPMRALLKLDLPEVQKVEVTNPSPTPIIPEVVFPEVQKVQVENQVVVPEVKFPEIQRVEVTNPIKTPDIQTVKVDNWPAEKRVEVQKVEITNPQKQQVIPVRKGKRQIGDEYVPVRLTDGERFYKAIDEYLVAASKGSPGNILLGYVVTGQKAVAVTGTAVNLPDNKLSNGVILTAKSTNSGNILVGMSNVSVTEDGSGNGYILEPGNSVSYGVTNTNTIWVNGSASDVVSWSGS